MKRTTITTLCVALMAFVAVTAICGEMNSFVSRIEKKQANLEGMGSGFEDLACITKKDLPVEAEESTLRDTKYVERLEQKLGSLIQESINTVDLVQPPIPAPPLFPGNLAPKSEFDESMDKFKTKEERKQ